MRINRKVQYGLLFVLHLSKEGNSTLKSSSDALGVSETFLSSIAVQLNKQGVVRSYRGPGGGYSLYGDPTVLDVFQALDPNNLLTVHEVTAYSRGNALTHKALVHLAVNLNSAMNLVMKRRISNIVNEMTVKEDSWNQEFEMASNGKRYN